MVSSLGCTKASASSVLIVDWGRAVAYIVDEFEQHPVLRHPLHPDKFGELLWGGKQNAEEIP
jgi:hypothetical protein